MKSMILGLTAMLLLANGNLFAQTGTTTKGRATGTTTGVTKARTTGTMQIIGDVQDLEGRDVYIQAFKDNGREGKRDTLTVTDGHFAGTVVVGDIPEERRIFLGRLGIMVWVEKGTMRISGSAKEFASLKVVGGKTQADRALFAAGTDSLTTAYREAYMLRQQDTTAAGRAKADVTLKALADIYVAKASVFIRQHPSSFESLNLVDRLSVDVTRRLALFNGLSARVRQSAPGKRFSEKLVISGRSAKGQRVLAFTREDVNGKPVSIGDFRGKYVLIDFWASWCHPCRAENPNVLAAYGRFKDKGFTVLGVSIDDDVSKWKKAIEEDGMPWTQVRDRKDHRSEILDYYGIEGIPSQLLVDPKGVIVARDLRGKALLDKLGEIFGGNAGETGASGVQTKGGTNAEGQTKDGAKMQARGGEAGRGTGAGAQTGGGTNAEGQTGAKTQRAGEWSDTTLSFLYNGIKAEASAEGKERLMMIMDRKFGGQEGQDQGLLEYSKGLVMESYAAEGNVGKVTYWLDRIKGKSQRGNAVYEAAQELIGVNKLTDAEGLLQPYLAAGADADLYKSDDNSFFGSVMPKSAYEYLHGVVLYKKGEYAAAVPLLATSSVGKRERSDPRREELYGMVLIGAGRSDAAIEQVRKTVLLSGERGADFSLVVQDFFRRLYGSDARYQALMDSASLVKHARVVEEMARYRVDQPAPDFVLTDAEGNTISLRSLKGKTVILDFWATWCQPCVASFPGMQRAVDYYAKDSSVVFAFVHTLERSPTAVADAKRFLATKHYRFHNYMDLLDTATGKHPAAAAFGITAIPTKFVINKAGVIRFRHSGYVPEGQAIEEVRTMVEEANE